MDHKIHQRKASVWFYCVPCLQRNGFGRRISAQTDRHLAKDRFIVKNGIEPQKWDNLLECVGDSETAFGQGWQPLESTCEKFGNSNQETHHWQKAEGKGNHDTEINGDPDVTKVIKAEIQAYSKIWFLKFDLHNFYT